MRYTKTTRWLVATLFICTLFACASKPKVLSAPQVLLQEINKTGKARVLLNNFSNVSMRFTNMSYALSIAGQPAAKGVLNFDLDVPQDSPEQVDASFDLTAVAQSALTGNGPVQYTLSGMITSSKPSRKNEYTYSGTLSPIPGKPGQWR
jgi:hypothetical protein